MMTETKKRNILAVLLFLIIMIVLASPACGEDEELLSQLPGQWTIDVGEEETITAVMTFSEDGSLLLLCSGADGEYLYSYEGAWSLTLVPDEMDRLTLLFTATDHPAYEGSGYSAECGYSVYAEGWVEEDVEHTYLILEDEAASGVSPFQDILGEAGGWPIGMHREEGPNMRVAHCKSFVSLREERSVSSARLAKVPLGAEVLAFTRYGEENGFLLCVYHGEYGYILSEYLEPIE